MKNSDLSSKTRFSYHWINFAAASLLAATLAGCGGGGGGGGGDTTAAAGTGTTTTTTATPSVTVPTGTAPITLTATTPAATFAALTPAVDPATGVSISIASPPKVTFALTDGNGNAIIGFGSKAQSATAAVASYPNLAFALAKLVPGTGSAPSRWVSYIVTANPTYKSATDKTVVAGVPARPSTDNIGTLVDNKDGTYTYTFFRDITKVKDDVAAATFSGNNVAADLDDLTFDPNLVHRLTINIFGNAPGTGTNTPDGVQVTPGVPMRRPLDVIYDFIPATGKRVTESGREIVATAKCNECHQSLGGFPGNSATSTDALFHGGNRNNTQYCVVCHTDQRKYGRAEAVVKADGNYDGLSTYRINGLAVGNLPTHIHKIHMSEFLTKTGYNYGDILYEEACKMPQDIRNCTKCHDGSETSTAKTAQGDNWKTVPSRKACGACHDGINFITGKGQSLNGVFPGHIGGAQADDSKCALCHDATTIPVYHLAVTPPDPANALLLGGTNANTNAAWIASNTSRLPAGAIKVSYEIQSVSRNSSKQPVMVFRLLQEGVAKAFNDKATKTEIWDNFMGAPSVYFAFAVPQDGVSKPADFNASASSYLRSLWNGSASGSSKGTLTGPDASGFYTATLTGVIIPDSAVMLTGGVGYTYNVTSALPLTQTNLADYPVTAATATTGLTTGMPNKTGGLIVVAPNVQKVATGYTGRRAIVEDARCNKCHQELGLFTDSEFHAGQRNDATTCSWCHTPNRTSSGWSADSTHYIHAIHAAAKREKKFTWHAESTTNGFFTIGYPGILNNCETCHLPNTYDFSAADSASALPNRLYRTAASGILNGTAGSTITTYSFSSSSGTCVAGTSNAQTALGVFSLSPYITPLTNYGIIFSYNAGLTTANSCKPDGTLVANPAGGTVEADGTTLVNSPIAGVCSACHDSALAQAHMKSNGGSLYAARTAALANAEQCTLCHLAGKVADIKVMHAK